MLVILFNTIDCIIEPNEYSVTELFVENVNWLFSGIGALALAGIFNRLFDLIRLIINNRKNNSPPNHNSSVGKSNERVFGYSIQSCIPPNGSYAKLDSVVHRELVLRNDGNFTWLNCYLQCENNSEGLSARHLRIIITETQPGQLCRIALDFDANHLGDYVSRWKMYDADNHSLFQENEYLIVELRITK